MSGYEIPKTKSTPTSHFYITILVTNYILEEFK